MKAQRLLGPKEWKEPMPQREGSEAAGSPPYSWDGQPFCSIQTFSGLDEVDLHQEVNLFCSVTDSNSNFMQKHSHGHREYCLTK